ncbi:HlyD family type I secretion periplasmic adaptor subunit [Undibacterium sp.]|uniref:HlyD family type I secretion periplasmic adaptor subunit n=1 Tax=Undibacterium sp. TaxID=1914977 RepID=UPI0037510250
MNNLITKKRDVTDVASSEVEVIELNTDTKSYSRVGWMIVLFGVVFFIIWASFAPLDQGVPMSGTVSVATNRKIVQHQLGGTIDEILVKDGEKVKVGQVLVRMNATVAKSALEIARSQYYAAKATEARLVAERDSAKRVNFPALLLKEKQDVRIANAIALQQQLFETRQSSLFNELGAADASADGLRSQLDGLQESMVSKKQQQQILKEQLDDIRDLAKEGFIAKNRLLELERTYAQVNGSVSEDIGNIGRLRKQISELGLRKAQRQQDYQKEVRTQLSDVQKEAESLQNRITALEYDLQNVDVKAPVSGIVVGMNIFTVGGVVPSGFKLMELVPESDALVVEGQLAVNLIDKVHSGLPVELIFGAFNTATTPHIPGVVTHVSADRTVDEKTGVPYYKVRAEVSPEGVKKLGNLQVRPGMPVDVVVKTGERTFMNYLLKPVLNRTSSALKEE